MENLTNVTGLPEISVEITKILSELLEKRKEHKLTQQEELDYYALHTLSMCTYGSQGVHPTYSENYIRKVEL